MLTASGVWRLASRLLSGADFLEVGARRRNGALELLLALPVAIGQALVAGDGAEARVWLRLLTHGLGDLRVVQRDFRPAQPVLRAFGGLALRLHLLQCGLVTVARRHDALLGGLHLPFLGLDRVGWRLVAVDDPAVGRDRLVERLGGRGLR